LANLRSKFLELSQLRQQALLNNLNILHDCLEICEVNYLIR